MNNNRNRCFSKDTFGVAAIEMAIILPLLLAIIVGVLEFGLYFTKSSVVERAVNNA